MTLVKWTPRTRQIDTVHDAIDDMFRSFFSDPWFYSPTTGGNWTPATDVCEEDARYVVAIDLPGMRREDIRISAENGTLTIQGERRRESGSKGRGFTRTERIHGSFTRSFTLPSTVDGNKIEATYKDGVLTVVLPKSEEARPKAIEVKVN